MSTENINPDVTLKHVANDAKEWAENKTGDLKEKVGEIASQVGKGISKRYWVALILVGIGLMTRLILKRR